MVIRGLSREKWFQSRGMFDLEVLAGVVFLGWWGGVEDGLDVIFSVGVIH